MNERVVEKVVDFEVDVDSVHGRRSLTRTSWSVGSVTKPRSISSRAAMRS